MRLIKAGHGKAVSRVASPFILWQLGLHNDVCPETGGLMPWKAATLYDHPVREVLAQRAIRAAWADERKKKGR